MAKRHGHRVVLITGCARSGTTLTARILEACGLNLGETNEFAEHLPTRETVLKPYLESLGADPLGQNPLPDHCRIDEDWRDRVLSVLDGNGYKDAKITLTWEQWHAAFPDALWVICRRDREAIVNSCQRTPFMRKRGDWENWVDYHLDKFEQIKRHTNYIEVWPNTNPDTFKPVVERCGLSWNNEAERVIDPTRWHDKPVYIDTLNNDPQVILSQVRDNIKRDLPWFVGGEQHNRKAILVGGGPSLKESLSKLRQVRRNADIFALNNAHDFLIERGITPDYHVMLDSREENADFVRRPKKSVTYLISACCHPKIFDALKNHKIILWLNDMDGVESMVKDVKDKPVCLIGGGATVGMKTMYLAYLMGYRHLHFFGFDSSYHDDANHAYPQPLNDMESRQTVVAAGKEFVCAPWMMKQAQEFQNQARKLLDLGCKLTVHGYGLIPHIVQNWR